MIFRPEPSLLTPIKERIWSQLKNYNFYPERVDMDPLSHEINQGEYLWPAVTNSKDVPNGLEIPQEILTNRLRRSIPSRFRTHSHLAPNLFHLHVPSSGEVRHILTFPVRPGDFIEQTWAPGNSDFWIFFEGMKTPRRVTDGGRRMAFLGGMFLPVHAHMPLMAAQTIKPAFPNILELPRP